MSPHITAMRCSVRCAGRTVASFVVLCFCCADAFAQDAQPLGAIQPRPIAGYLGH